MQEMSIYGVSFDIGAKQPIVLLKTKNDNKFLPIWIGSNEATAILMKLQGVETARPMTHDLLNNVVSGLEGEVTRITVTDLRDSTFFALITVRVASKEIEIDSRPSDALALAVRTDAPIFAADKVIEDSALVLGSAEPGDTEDVVEAFKEFLDEVNPEDFAG
ncbi:MAG: bifunctional nuclease family protein [Actinobacteria bacterium]|nr:bifunctional nuclease family protein [Thermoleophilia bacterium]MCB9011613.1 bifunctional nuclease family protein [Actinomycetota bacterium]